MSMGPDVNSGVPYNIGEGVFQIRLKKKGGIEGSHHHRLISLLLLV